MLADAVVIYVLHQTEKQLKREKEKDKQEAHAAAAAEHETDKKATRAQKAATRSQRKQEEKKIAQTAGQASFAPRVKVMQPDKNKKSR
jgi:hypothetical protein